MRKFVFAKIKYLILILFIILIGLGTYLAILWQFGDQGIEQICEPTDDIFKPVQEFAAGLYGYYDYVYINPKKSEIEKIFFDQDGRLFGVKRLTNDGYLKSNLELFANDGPAFGYYQELHKGDEDFNENNDEEERNRYYDNYIALMIDKNDGLGPVEVYRGNVHTSNWEWEDINHVRVYNGCGTCCRYYYLININTKVVEDEGHLEEEEAACIQPALQREK